MPGSSHSARRRLQGVAIRPEAVRRARLEKGLSLAELAGGKVTRAAMHLVETGKMRPSMRTLELIARQTGRPISYFLAQPEGSDEQRAARDELLLLVEHQDYAGAISLAGGLLEQQLDAGVEADVRFCLGKAHVQTRDADRALSHLARARQLFERIGDSWMLAHTLEQEAVAMFLVQDPRALARALDTLDRCEALDPPAPALQASVLTLIGSIHLRREDWRNAARFFEMGVQVSDRVVSLRQAARLHDGLSVAKRELGDFAAALRSAERAAALYSAEGDGDSLIRAENNLGYMLLRQGELDAAARHLHEALRLCDEHDARRYVRAPVLNSVGELHLARREPRVAIPRLLEALDVASALGERSSEATARHLLARAHLQLGDDAAARAAFDEAIWLLSELGLSDRLCDCAAEYADLLHRDGELEESIKYWRMAVAAARRSATGPVEDPGLLRQSGA